MALRMSLSRGAREMG
jgi:hypothetical protein